MERQYVGIDLHRRRSVIVRKSSDGELLSKVHIDDPITMAQAVSAAGPEPDVVLEATFGWTGPPTCWPRAAPTCTWPTLSAKTGATGG